MFGIFRRKRDAKYSEFRDVGFHGDRHLLALVDDLVTRHGIECFVETGTNVGSSLVYFAKRFPHVRALSCEPDAEACRRAKEHASGLANVEIHNLASERFLKVLAGTPGLFEKRCLFWLDAHGHGFRWPLRDEVRFIAERFASAFVMIDDFKVPGLDAFRYDEYDGQVCSYEHIRDALGSRRHEIFQPRYTERTSTHHPLVGWGLIVLGAQYAVPPALQALVGRSQP